MNQSLLPAGFTASTVTYQEQNIMGGENGDMTILYLQDPEGSEGFWFYDAESGEFTRYANIHVSEKNITVLPADEAPEVPEGFAETTIQLNGDYKVEGWVWESDTEQRYCVVYGMNENEKRDCTATISERRQFRDILRILLLRAPIRMKRWKPLSRNTMT